MSSWVYRQRALPWHVFLELMSRMTERLDKIDYPERLHLARYQAAIAFGCYHGPNFNELTHVTWDDVLGGYYTFRYEKRPLTVIDQQAKAIIWHNHTVIQPDRNDEFVIQHPLYRNKSVNARIFNQALRQIFEQFGVDSPEANSQTLRKTFARKIYRDFGYADIALDILKDELGYSLHLIKVMVRTDEANNIHII